MDLILKNEKALFDKYKDKSTSKHDYLSDAKNYLKQLIEEKVVEGYTFEELKTLKFEGSEYHTKLDNLINYDESYDEFEDTSAKDDLYDTVSENFGKDFLCR